MITPAAGHFRRDRMGIYDIELQAEKLNDYVRRGGSSKTWLASKGFSAKDRKAILEASVVLAKKRMAVA